MSLYITIADAIMEKIKTGEWMVGYMIPSEKELCEQFHVSRPTVRSALSILVNQGYLERVKGKGSFVSRPRIIESSTVFLESFSRELHEKGLEVQTEVLEHRMMEADETVAEKLGLRPGDEVIKLVRLRYVKDSFREGPIVYNVSYFPGRYEFLLKCNFEKESLTQVLKHNHVQRRHLKKYISAILLNGKIARILGVAENSLGVLISAVCCASDIRQAIEYTQSYYPSDRNTFLLEIRM